MSRQFSFQEIKRLNDAVSKGDYSHSIAHYTSESNLQNIIQGNELWLGRIDQMNDATEFTHYADAVRLVAHKIVSDVPVSVIDAALDKFEADLKYSTYISSWCEYHEDEPEGRLPMWLAYGDKASGVAAIIDSTQMQPSTITAPRFAYFVATSQVEYVRKKDVESTASMLIDRVRSSGILSQVANSEEVLGGMLMARAPTSKHQSFKEEKEVRFLTMPKFLTKNGRFVPEDRIRHVDNREFFSLELKNWAQYDLDLRLKRILKKVLIGPLNRPYERADRMRDLLDGVGLDHVPVEVVDIPLRD